MLLNIEYRIVPKIVQEVVPKNPIQKIHENKQCAMRGEPALFKALASRKTWREKRGEFLLPSQRF